MEEAFSFLAMDAHFLKLLFVYMQTLKFAVINEFS